MIVIDTTGRDPITYLQPLREVIGAWYLKGYADAFDAHWPMIPSGWAGEDYKKGYALGLAAVRDLYFSALNSIGCEQAAVMGEAHCG